VSRPAHDTPTLPVPPPDGVATGVRVLESQARDARTWAALSQEQQARALAVFRRSHGFCLRCGLPAQTGETACFGCAVDGCDR
jgi:hypothetical protein